MTDKEVNKIIAEFMGYKLCEESGIMSGEKIVYKHSRQYTISLDALVLVWEKLRMFPMISEYKFKYQCNLGFVTGEVCTKDTIQQAAAHATAKAILELKDEQ